MARRVYSFCSNAIDSWEEEDKLDKNVKRRKYAPSIEKFNFACELYGVKQEDKLEAMEWVHAAVEAANEAPEMFIRAERRRRFGK